MAKRRQRKVWSDGEERMICAQARLAGVSVSQVARRYEVNAKQVFNWLKDPRLQSGEVVEDAVFLPVEISGGGFLLFQHLRRALPPEAGLSLISLADIGFGSAGLTIRMPLPV